MSDSITPEDIDAVFRRCDDCETYVVRGASHKCSTGTVVTNVTSPMRDRLRELDGGDPGERLVASKKHTSAYHHACPHADPDPYPSCRTKLRSPHAEWVFGTRAEFQSRDMYPCRYCFSIDLEANT